MIITTHNGPFHADDVFAVATLLLRYGKECDIVRTRDPHIIKTADIVVDVGQEYDEDTLRFDHHQGPPLRPGGLPYASFGLVWKKYGAGISGSSEAAAEIDCRLVVPIDVKDNSIETVIPALPNVMPYIIQDVFNKALRPTWLEEQDFDGAFRRAVDMATLIIQREIALAQAKIQADMKLGEAYEKAADKRILVLDRHYPFDAFASEHPDVLFAVFPGDIENATWNVKTVGVSERSFVSRRDLPEGWAGKRDAELVAATGVSDAIFCHRGRFLAVAKSKEGAITLAELALRA